MSMLNARLTEIANEAIKMLSLIDASRSEADTKLHVAVLAQSSPEEICEYLSFRAFKALRASKMDDVIVKNELYVATTQVSETTFDCSCLFGYTILHPPIKIRTSGEIKEMWEFLQKLMSPNASCDFQTFMEKIIREAIEALIRYERMLSEELVPIVYTLMSEEGERIHDFLFADIKEKMINLVGYREKLVEEKAPEFMFREHAEHFAASKNIFNALLNLKPREV